MRAYALILTLPFLAGCAADGNFASSRQVIEDIGGQKIVLDNGVCIRIDETGEHGQIHRVAPSRCQV